MSGQSCYQSSHHAGSHKCVCFSSCVLHRRLVGLSYRRIKKKYVWNVPLPNTRWKSAWKEWAPFGWRRTETLEPDLHMRFADGSAVAVLPPISPSSKQPQACLASIFRSSLQNSLLRWGAVNGELISDWWEQRRIWIYSWITTCKHIIVRSHYSKALYVYRYTCIQMPVS